MLVLIVVVVVARVGREERHEVGNWQCQVIQVDSQVRNWQRDKLFLVRLVVRSVVVASILSGDASDQSEHDKTDDGLF